MVILGFDRKELMEAFGHYQALAERYAHIPETHAGYEGRVAMLRDLIWNWPDRISAKEEHEVALSDPLHDQELEEWG